MDSIRVYVEQGDKYTFAGALEWPGWCRRGRSLEQALQTFVEYGARYAAVLRETGLEFAPAGKVDDLEIVQRLPGSATTDFGAPDAIPDQDIIPLDLAISQHYARILQACWRAFDASLAAAQGKELRKGPRGGGRDQEKMQQHVLDADLSYLRAAGWKHKDSKDNRLSDRIDQTRQAVLATLEAAVTGSLPIEGPRGGKIWPPRYFVRRTAWHVLDHAWEIEDRIED